MCLSCVSPLQSVMVYWCSTDVTNKDYPCAAIVCVCCPSLGVVKTLCSHRNSAFCYIFARNRVRNLCLYSGLPGPLKFYKCILVLQPGQEKLECNTSSS